MNAVPENPLIPMGAVTGRPDRKQIRAFLKAFREAGVTQFLIYPRSGCEIEYMSQEWFDTCRNIIEECREQGFSSLWLYDEFNWPSGQCGGRIMRENPDHALKFLRVSEKNGVYSFEALSNPNAPNVLDPEAVRKFIAYTHERYAEHFGKDFGGLIKGIFSDEPSFLYIGGAPTEETRLDIAFYPGLEEDYEKLTGSSLKEDLQYCLRNHSAFFWEPFVCKLLGKRFLESFILPVRDWCDRHKLLMTGHLMQENCLGTSMRASGSPMAVTDSFSLPGLDEIRTHTVIERIEWNTLGTVEHAVRKNGNGGLAELFALGPCDMTPDRVRRQLRFVSMFGIDHYVLAISPFDMRGNTVKTGYFNPFSPAQPWFSALGKMGEDARVSAAVARREFKPEIQVRRPASGVQLNELLIRLVQSQRQWSLIGEDEEGTAPVVLRVDPEGLTAEKMPDGYDRHWDTFANGLLILDELVPLKTCVTEADGTLARDIFLRTFADGSVEVANFSGSREVRNLRLRREGRELTFELQPDGIRSFCGWKISTDRPNLKRLAFADGVCTFRLESALDGLVLLLRQHEVPVALELDGEPVKAAAPADALPQGFRELYLGTPSFRLGPGEHTISMKEDLPDYPFLPSAFLAGNFADFGETLAPYAQDGAGLENYTGKIIQTGWAEIPCGAAKLRFETDGLYTELYLDGEKMPERLYAPFVWRIPERFAGKTVSIRIERFSSCGPMFGEITFPVVRPGGWTAADRRPSGKVRHPAVELEFLP